MNRSDPSYYSVDKSNNYDFIYHQHVIKPALIGLIGAWISGGIEWNIPHHHRATTFLPVQERVDENEDGSKTVWVRSTGVVSCHVDKLSLTGWATADGIGSWPGRCAFNGPVDCIT